MADIAFNTEELGYIAPEEAHTKVFEGLNSEKQIAKYKDALGMLKPNNQLWLCIAILRYRNNGFISKNKNPFMQEIFRDLVGLKHPDKVVVKKVLAEDYPVVVEKVKNGSDSSDGSDVPTPFETSEATETGACTELVEVKPSETAATGSFLSRLINKIF